MTWGHAAQYQFRTARVTVVSPARAGEASPPSARVIETSILVRGRFISRFVDQRGKEVKGNRTGNEDGRQNEAEHHEAVWQGP
jgi:hypothetical protein